MGPACAVVEIKDGRVTVWTGSQKPHFARDGVAAMLGMTPEQVHGDLDSRPGLLRPQRCRRCGDGRRAVWPRPSASRCGCNICAIKATGWDPKGPASVHRARAAIDASGKVDRLRIHEQGPAARRRQFEREPALRHARRPAHRRDAANRVMASACRRSPTASPTSAPPGKRCRRCSIAARRCAPRICAIRSGRKSTSPANPSWTKWQRRSNMDPIEFRLRYVSDPRDIAVIKAAAEKAGWQPRPSPRKDQSGNKVSGHGIAYAQRGPTRVAIVAEVDVDRRSGKIWARKFTVAHDCGQIVNPDGLRHAIEGNIVQGISRTLWEEVKFDAKAVTSVDWLTYPILDITETPEHDRRRADRSPGDRAVRRGRTLDAARSRRRSPMPCSTPPASVFAGCRSRRTTSNRRCRDKGSLSRSAGRGSNLAAWPLSSARSTKRSHRSPTAACWRCRARARARRWRRHGR